MEHLGLIFAGLASIMWGLTYSLDQKSLEQIPASLLLFLTSLSTTLILLPFLLSKGYLLIISEIKPDNIKFLALTILTTIVANLLILMSIKYLGASEASLLEISYPLFVILFTALMFGEKINLITIFGGTLIGAGSILIIKQNL